MALHIYSILILRILSNHGTRQTLSTLRLYDKVQIQHILQVLYMPHSLHMECLSYYGCIKTFAFNLNSKNPWDIMWTVFSLNHSIILNISLIFFLSRILNICVELDCSLVCLSSLIRHRVSITFYSFDAFWARVQGLNILIKGKIIMNLFFDWFI